MIRSFGDIIDLWPSAEVFGAEIGTTGVNARKMKSRNSIDGRYWQSVVGAAAVRGFSEVTLELLAKLAAAKAEAAPSQGAAA